MKKLLLSFAVLVLFLTISACEEVDPDDELTDQDKVELVKDALELDGDLSAVTEDLVLPLTGDHDVEIEWSSSNTNVISLSGNVTRGEEDQTVTLTATIMLNDAVATKEFEVTVLEAEESVIDETQFLNMDFSEGLTYWDFTGASGNLSGSIQEGGPEGGSDQHVRLSVNRTLGNSYDAKFRQRNKTVEPGIYQLSFYAKASEDFGFVELTFGSFGGQFPAKEIYPMKNIPTEWTLFDNFYIEVTETITDATIEFGVGLGNPNGKSDPTDDTIPSTLLHLADVALTEVDTFPGWQPVYDLEDLDFESIDGWMVTPKGELSGRITPVINPGEPNELDITIQNVGETVMAARWDAKFYQRYVSQEAGVYRLSFEAKVDDASKFNELYVYYGSTRVTFTELTEEYVEYEMYVDTTSIGNTHRSQLEFDFGLALANEEDVLVYSMRNLQTEKIEALPDDILVQNAYDELDLGNLLNISADVLLPTEAEGGVVITWESTDPTILSEEGVFVAPEGSATVTLTATITLNDEELTKEFVYEWVSVTTISYVIEEEMLLNGSMDVDADEDGLTDGFEVFANGGAATTTIEEDGERGTVQKVLIDSGNTSPWNLKFRQTGLVYDADTYQASFWAKTESDIEVNLVMGVPANHIKESGILLRSGWHFYVIILDVPANENARLEFELGSLDAGTAIWFDDMSLGKVQELLPNGDFSDETDPLSHWEMLDANTTMEIVADDTYGDVAKVTMLNNSNEFFHRKFRQQNVEYVADTTYVVTFYYKADQADAFRLFLGMYENGKDDIKFTRVLFDATTEWQMAEVLFTPTEGSTGRFEFEIGPMINDNALYIGHVSMRAVDQMVTE